MKLCLIIIFVIGKAANVNGLKCISCNEYDYNGESTSCFLGSGIERNCSVSTDKYYCQTIFTVQDGIVTTVSRGCVDSQSDEDIYSEGVPTNEKCITQLSAHGNPTDSTSCYYHCDTDNCNSQRPSNLLSCKTSCFRGSCNYITGECHCNSGYSGVNCTRDLPPIGPNPTAPRRCLQCNNATDSTCSSSTTSTDCPSLDYYCSTATTSIYDQSDKVISTIVTRGCTSSFKAVDECLFTDIYNDRDINSFGYNEFTCFSTCDTDGCNTNNANGVIDGNEKVLMECEQCQGTSDCSRGQTTCPSGTTHCKATVVYMISDRASNTPIYKPVSVVRECATAAVATGCTSSNVGGLSFKKVTCTESCQTDGCNTGWPARPKCSSCVSSPSNRYDSCLENPPFPSDCNYPYQSYCYINEYGIKKGSTQSIRGYPHSISRGCTHYDMGTSCTSETPRSTEIEDCTRVCTTDGCNVGSGSPMLYQTFTFIAIATGIGWVAQLNL